MYATIALDWTLGRHGDDLRQDRLPRSSWLDRPAAPAVWLLIALAWVLALAICCHVDPKGGEGGSPYIVFGGLSRARSAVALGAVGVGTAARSRGMVVARSASTL